MVILAVALLPALVACGGRSPTPAGTATPTPANEATASVQAVTVTARAGTAEARTATAEIRAATATVVSTTQPTSAARAATLAATQTAAASDPSATATFAPATPSPRIATVAAATIAPATPTVPGTNLPKEGTPFSIPSANGQLVSVGERRMWIACRGAGLIGPTVVMDAGVNSGSQAWALVQPGIASFARVCVYDRAGLGRSDPIPRPRTSQEVVDDLHGLLKNAGVPGPYILVAHSFGGLNVRLYAGQFPQEVIGMVLVDAVHEDRFAATAKVLTPEQEKDFEKGREANPEGLDYYESSRLVRDLGKPLPDIPIVVIARGRAEPWPPGWPVAALEQTWRDLESDLANRAPRGALVIAMQSDHNIPGEQPQIIVDATRRVMERARTGSR